jgi:hypothetical protein
MIFLTILFAIAVFVGVVHEVIFMIGKGTPPKDKDVLEMLDKYRNTYSISKNWDDQFRLESDVDWKSDNPTGPRITKFNYSILWLGYIEGAGVVPRWYKSSKILKQIFNEKIKASKYYQTKRSKLGL